MSVVVACVLVDGGGCGWRWLWIRVVRGLIGDMFTRVSSKNRIVVLFLSNRRRPIVSAISTAYTLSNSYSYSCCTRSQRLVNVNIVLVLKKDAN